MQQHVCPKDGQTMDWHLKYWEVDALGNPRFFGDQLGCGYIGVIDRLNATDRHKQKMKETHGQVS